MRARIERLTPELISRLRSGVAITCIAQCVEELVLNAVDADASCIAVRLNLSFGKIQVIDNGSGIPIDDLKLVGERYATSKCHTLDDLINLKYHGFRGEAIASIRDVSAALEITSRPTNCAVSYLKSFHLGKNGRIFASETPRASVGTTVTILDFLYNLPVRKKLITETRSIENCRRVLECVALMNPSVSFSLWDDFAGEVILQTRKCNTIRGTFIYLFGHLTALSMKDFDFRKEDMRLVGLMSTEGSTSKDLQLLYLNQRRIIKTQLHNVLKLNLRRFMFSKGLRKNSQSPGKSLPQNPNYVLNLCCPLNDYVVCFEPQKTMVEFIHWERVFSFVEEAILKFVEINDLLEMPSESHPENVQEVAKQNEWKVITTENAKYSLHSLAAKKPISYLLRNGCEPPITKETAFRNADFDENKLEHDKTSAKKSIHARHINNNVTVNCISSLDRLKKKVERMKQEEMGQVSDSTAKSPYACRSLKLDNIQTRISREKKLDLKEFQFDAKRKKVNAQIHPLQSSHKIKDSVEKPISVMRRDIVDRRQEITTKETAPTQINTSLPDAVTFGNKTKNNTSQSCLNYVRTEATNVLVAADKLDLSFCSSQESGIHSLLSLTESPTSSTSFPCFLKTFSHECILEDDEDAHYPDSDKITSVKENGNLFDGCNTKINSPSTISDCPRSLYSKLRQLDRENFPERLKTKKARPLPPEKQATEQKNNAVPLETYKGCGEIISMSEEVHNTKDTTKNVSVDTKFPLGIDKSTENRKTWVKYEDENVGCTVYIDTKTGNSSYDASAYSSSELQERTADGIKPSTHFLLSHDCEPFLSRPVTERPEFNNCMLPESDSKVTNMFKDWENPIFKQSKEIVSAVVERQGKSSVIKVYNMLQQYRFMKEHLQQLKFLGQIDCKFLVCLMSYQGDNNLVVLFDQHAVHERIRLESFIDELYESIDERRQLITSDLDPPMILEVTPEVLRKARIYCQDLLQWGVNMSVDSKNRILVSRVPSCLTRKGYPCELVVQNLIMELLGTLHDTGSLSTLPKTILEILSSRACHGAVKFGDPLEVDKAKELIAALVNCKLPFQCAHGRPSLAPILDVRHLPSIVANDEDKPERLNLHQLRTME